MEGAGRRPFVNHSEMQDEQALVNYLTQWYSMNRVTFVNTIGDDQTAAMLNETMAVLEGRPPYHNESDARLGTIGYIFNMMFETNIYFMSLLNGRFTKLTGVVTSHASGAFRPSVAWSTYNSNEPLVPKPLFFMSDEDSLTIWTILSDVVTFAKNHGIIGDHEANTHLIFADIQMRRANLSDPMEIDPSLHTDGMTSPMDDWLRTTDEAFVRNVESVNRQLSRPTRGGLSVLIYLKNEPDWIGTELCYVDCNGNRFAYRPKNLDVIVFNNRTEHGRCMRNIVGNPGEDLEHKSRVLLRFRISFMDNQDGTPPVVPGQCDRYLAQPALA